MCIVVAESENQVSDPSEDPYSHMIGVSVMELMVLEVHLLLFQGNCPSWPPPLDQHFALTWPSQLQFLHLGWELVWNTTLESLPPELSPCLLLHSVLRHDMTTFGSRIPSKVPITGSQEGDSMDRVKTPQQIVHPWYPPLILHRPLVVFAIQLYV